MGRRDLRIAPALAALALLLAAPRAAAPAPDPAASGVADADPLALAPEGEWPMQDGCPARTRATRTRFPAAPLEVAWTWEAPAPIAGDPCVAGERVFVGTAPDDAGVAFLDVLRLADGKPVVARRKHAHGLSVRPVAWRDVVVVPSRAGELEALRVVAETGKLASIASFPGAPDPLLVDGDVVTVVGDRVERRRPGAPEPRWTATLPAPAIGPLAARAGQLYVVTSGPRQGYEGTRSAVECLGLASGASRPGCVLGWDAAQDERESRVVVGAHEIFVHHPRGVALKDLPAATGVRVWLFDGRPMESFPFALRAPPVAWGGRAFFVGRPVDDAVDVLGASDPVAMPSEKPGGWRYAVLATGDRHAELREGAAPWVVAGGVCDAPRGVFEAVSDRVVELRRTGRTSRLVPVRETLLVVEGRRVIALRGAQGATAGGGPRLVASAAGGPVAGAAVVTIDGTARAGDVALAADGSALTLGKETLPLADVGLVVDREGRVLHGPDAGFVARRLPASVAARSRAEWLALAKKAVATRSAPVLARAVDDLASRGGRADDLLALRKELVKLEKPQGAPPKVVPAKVAEVETARDALLAAERAALSRAVASLPADAPLRYRGALLRALLAEDRAHAETVAWLRARLPAGFDPGAEVLPTDWLDLVEATAQTPIQVLAKKPDGAGLSMDDRVYGSLRHFWRQDLVALRSDRLLLVTPVARPSRIARSLSLGELVCSTLDALFEVPPDQAKAIEPLAVQLFESKAEYLARSTDRDDDREAGRAALSWTLGHYDAEAGISRLFVPAGDDRFDGVMETLAHELAHHWLDQRMPLPPGEKRTHYGPGSPGYFLEEGFATMVEELVYDLDARTFSTVNPRADSLDAVAQSPTLLPWDGVLESTPAQFARLSRKPVHEVPCRWTLGRHRTLSDTNLFYAQGAAVCHWMWNADGGKRRAALREWVRDLHRNRLGPGESARRLGMTPAQVGAAVVAWARAASAPK